MINTQAGCSVHETGDYKQRWEIINKTVCWSLCGGTRGDLYGTRGDLVVCKPNLVFCFGPNQALGLGMGLGPSRTIKQFNSVIKQSNQFSDQDLKTCNYIEYKSDNK